jgi:ribonuclease BN (tRNA processing enzyme)
VAAKVKTLILKHLIPPERDIASERDWESEVKEQFSGATIIGYDGLSMPFQKG